MYKLRRYFPFLEWAGSYKKADLSGDLAAGLTVGVMLIPQGMAYAMLAGLPPIYGLYASTIPLIIYALFGTSRQLAVGPVAMVALLVSSGVGNIATQGSSEFISLAILLALMVGAIQLLMGVFRIGFIVNFLSHPVIAGFTSSAALIIGFSQLKHLLGISIPSGKVHETLINVGQNLDSINTPTLLIGLVAIIVMIISKKLHKKIPGPLVVVLLGMTVVYFLGLSQEGVSIVKEIPEGLPDFSFPILSFDKMQLLLPTAITISLIGFMESVAIAKAIQNKHKNYTIIPNQELISLGLANIIGSFFKAFPVTGGFSRTAVNDQAGAKTSLASIISAILIIITLLFLTDYFYYLPNAVLAAIIMVAVYGLIDFKEAKNLWNTDKRDFLLFMVTAVATLILGIEEGIVIGLLLSLAMVIYRVSYPHFAELGLLEKSGQYRNIKRFPNLLKEENTLIMRFDAQLYFANANYFRDTIYAKLRENEKLTHVVIHAGSISSIDSSALHILKDMITHMKIYRKTLYFAELIGPVRDTLVKNGIVQLLGPNHFFLSIEEAIAYIRTGEVPINQHLSTQSNVDLT